MSTAKQRPRKESMGEDSRFETTEALSDEGWTLIQSKRSQRHNKIIPKKQPYANQRRSATTTSSRKPQPINPSNNPGSKPRLPCDDTKSSFAKVVAGVPKLKSQDSWKHRNHTVNNATASAGKKNDLRNLNSKVDSKASQPRKQNSKKSHYSARTDSKLHQPFSKASDPESSTKTKSRTPHHNSKLQPKNLQSIQTQDTLVDIPLRLDIEELQDFVNVGLLRTLEETWKVAEMMGDLTMTQSIGALVEEYHLRFCDLITLHQAEETESLRDLFQLDLADDVTSESLLDSEHLSIQSLPSSKFTQSFNRGAHPYGVGSKQISSSSITLISRSSSTSWSDAVRGNKFSNHDHYHPSERPYTPDGGRSVSSPQRPPSVRQTPDPLEIKRKQAKAQELRESILINKAQKARLKEDKIQEIRIRKEIQMERQSQQLKEIIVEKQIKAEKLREEHLKKIQSKAKEEKAKVEEIALTSQINIQTKKAGAQGKREEADARIQEMEEERLRKSAETAALQEAATERRRQQESERMAKIQRDHDRKKDLEVKKEMERSSLLAMRQAKEEEKFWRIKDFKEHKQAEEDELRRNVVEKMEKAIERHEECIELVKVRAAALNEKASEVASRVIKGRKSPDMKQMYIEVVKKGRSGKRKGGSKGAPSNENESVVIIGKIECWKRSVDETSPSQPTGRAKNIVKKAKNLRTNIKTLAEEFLKENIVEGQSARTKGPLDLQLDQMLRLLEKTSEKGFNNWETLEKVCNDVAVQLARDESDDLAKVRERGALTAIVKAISHVDGCARPLMPPRAVNFAVQVLKYACLSDDNRKHMLMSSDMLMVELSEFLSRILPFCYPGGDQSLLATSAVFATLTWLILYDGGADVALSKMSCEVLSYICTVEIIEKLRSIFLVVHGPVDLPRDQPLMVFLQRGASFLDAVSGSSPFHSKISSAPSSKRESVVKGIMNSFEATEFVGLITMLDALVLYKGHTAKSASSEQLPPEIIEITFHALKTLNNFAMLSYSTFQNLLQDEVSQTEFFHLVIFWLSYCSTWSHTTRSSAPFTHQSITTASPAELTTKVLNEIILMVGHYALRNPKGRALLRWGQAPVILQQLVNLPFKYFTDARLIEILFPTLLLSCFKDDDNRQVVEEEMSADMLVKYLRDKKSDSAWNSALVVKTGANSPLKETETVEDSAIISVSTARFDLVNRFPVDLWDEALKYLSN